MGFSEGIGDDEGRGFVGALNPWPTSQDVHGAQEDNRGDQEDKLDHDALHL